MYNAESVFTGDSEMNVAFIPVRGGSKSIPLKNIKSINGRPLVYWVVKAACECEYIDVVYVSTDSEEIRNTVEAFREKYELENGQKINVIGRSPESASDTASTEYAMLEFAKEYEFDNIALIQATSPLLSGEDLNRGFEVFSQAEVDSVLSVVRQKRFHWQYNDRGFVYPTNYDVFKRPRRQEFEGYLVENGAFYISSKRLLVQSQNRISGNIKAVEMNEDTFYEIDEPDDWKIIELLMKKYQINDIKHKLPEIKMFLSDCDGCLTDGGMYYSESGDEIKKFNTRDGVGFSLLRQRGILTGIVTSENVDLNRRRAEKLKLDILEMGCADKVEVIKRLCRLHDIKPENVLYIGDDINDVDALKMVGYSCCPADAVQEVKQNVLYVARTKGGNGVIREVADKVICQLA